MMKLTTAKMLKLWTTQRPARMKRTRTRSRRTEKMTVVEWRPGSEKNDLMAKFVNLGNLCVRGAQIGTSSRERFHFLPFGPEKVLQTSLLDV